MRWLPTFNGSRSQRRNLERFPAVSGAYTYTPTAIRGWVNSLGAKRFPADWEQADIRIVARQGLRVVAEAKVGLTVKEGPLIDGRRTFVLSEHGIGPYEILVEQITLHIVLEGVERDRLTLYPSEQIRLIHEVFPNKAFPK